MFLLVVVLPKAIRNSLLFSCTCIGREMCTTHALLLWIRASDGWQVLLPFCAAIHTTLCSRFVHDRTDPAVHALDKVEAGG